MEVREMKKKIREVYPGERWQKKVDRMSDSQVMAVYYSFKKEGKL